MYDCGFWLYTFDTVLKQFYLPRLLALGSNALNSSLELQALHMPLPAEGMVAWHLTLSDSLQQFLFYRLARHPLCFNVHLYIGVVVILGSLHHDLTSGIGLATAVASIWMLDTGSLSHFATCCTSCCWINSATHGRSKAFPLGTALTYVQTGNRLIGATVPWQQTQCPTQVLLHMSQMFFFTQTFHSEVALALLTWYRGCVWTLEQPRGSVLQEHPAMQQLLHLYQRYKEIHGLCTRGVLSHPHCLGSFGAPSEKPIMLYAAEHVQLVPPSSLHTSSRGVSLATVYYDQSGQKRVTGTSDLKQSQEYPEMPLALLFSKESIV